MNENEFYLILGKFNTITASLSNIRKIKDSKSRQVVVLGDNAPKESIEYLEKITSIEVSLSKLNEELLKKIFLVGDKHGPNKKQTIKITDRSRVNRNAK